MKEKKNPPHEQPAPEIVQEHEAPKAGPPAVITERRDTVEEGAITPFEGDYMEITASVAQHLVEYEKAIDTILNFIIRRTYAGDWVSHDKDSTPIEERTASPSSAAMERVARDIGIQESERTQPVKILEEEGKGHYRYECVGKFTFRGRTVEAKGIASTKNPFHLAKAGGDPSKIRSEYLVQEAWRDCTKQGVKALFGLRRIPVMKLQDLGYDISKVKYVSFKDKENSQAKTNPEATAKPEGAEGTEIITTQLAEIKFRKWGDKDITDLTDSDGVVYSWWGKGSKDAENVALVAAQKAAKNVSIEWKLSKGKYRNVVSVTVQP